MSVVWATSCTNERTRLATDITKGEQQLFADSSRSLNTQVAENVLNSYLAFAAKFPEDTMTPEYLFRSADLANGLHHSSQSLELFARVCSKYPEHRKAAAALFMQAFISETVLQDKEKAKKLYGEFLQKYPSHQLSVSAKASLDQLNSGMSDEELIRMFESRQDSSSAAR